MTYRELIYACLDLAKQVSDDMTINEEHVRFLIDKFRASLLWQKYKTVKLEVPEANYQTLCLDLEQVTPVEGNSCDDGVYLRSTCIPSIINIGNPVVFPKDFYKGVNIVLIPRERMRFAGDNKYLKNIIYCSINPDGRLYLKSNNPQFIYLKKIYFTGIFEEPFEAAKLECNTCTHSCEPIDNKIPFEEDLVPNLIDGLVKEIVSAAYRPSDQINNANDDLSDIIAWARRNMKNSLQKQIEE